MSAHRRIYEKFHGIKIPKGMHIHHIDGNHSNNDPLNLQMVTPEEHCRIHCERGDPWYDRKMDKWISGASEAGRKGGSVRGKKMPPRKKEHTQKLRLANLGRKQSIETIEKRISKTTGKKRTEKFKEEHSKRFLGEKNPMFDWTNRSDSLDIVEKQKLGRKNSEKAQEALKVFIESAKGRKHTAEAKEKCRQVALRRWARHKENLCA